MYSDEIACIPLLITYVFFLKKIYGIFVDQFWWYVYGLAFFSWSISLQANFIGGQWLCGHCQVDALASCNVVFSSYPLVESCLNKMWTAYFPSYHNLQL